MLKMTHHGGVFVVTIDNPPVNAMNRATRHALSEMLDLATSDPEVRAIVLHGAGRGFSGGADISEFGGADDGLSLPILVDRLEASVKPIVAAIHGMAFGGGLEIALAAHYRIATPSAKLGLPEVKLGILPGAGGTQRLPRIIGVEPALSMIVGGEPISGVRGAELGLIDRLAREDALVEDAIAFAAEIADCTDYPVASSRADRLDEARADPAVFDRFKQGQGRRLAGLDAPAACIQALKAALDLPYAQGVETERALFMQLLSGSQSKALRHNFFAERAANKINDIAADTPLIPVETVGILGAGTMGGGIAMNFLSAGIPVTILEREREALDRGVATIQRNYDRMAERGRMTAQAIATAMSLLTPTLTYDDLSDCDLIIEAVFETMEVKKEVFGKLDAIAKPGAILASNTSYLNIDEMALETRRPEQVIGLHFFSPANMMRLLEIVRSARTSDTVLATAMTLARRIGKTAVVSGVCYGFIGNRMLSPRQRQANALMMEGAQPWDIDRVLVEFGFPMGPFQMADLAGLDLGWNRDRSRGETIRDVLCERDRRGQKTGKGFYDYDESRRGTPSAEVEAVIAEFRARSGKPLRVITDDEIRERLLFSMVNEGAKILDEGIAQRASDIDVVWLNGYGWPAVTGGPTFWADTIGLSTVLKGLESHAAAMGDDFEISPLLRRKAEAGETLNP